MMNLGKYSIFSDRTSIFFLIAYLFLSLLVFFVYGLPGLDGTGDIRLGADSTYYMGLAQSKLSGNEVSIDFFSISSILILLGNNLLLVVVFNLLSFLFAYISTIRCFNLDKSTFLFWVFINPMFMTAWITPSKEILAFVAIMYLNCFIKSRKYFYVFLAGLFAISARYQLFFVLILFTILISNLYHFQGKRSLILASFTLLISFSYPYISGYLLGDEINGAINYYFDTSTGGGMIILLNDLQNRGLFFVSLIPKVLLNLIGNIPKIQDCFSITKEPDGQYDFYNTWITIGHQICILTMFIKACVSRKLKIDLSNDFTYYICIHVIFFAITPFVQPRYMFPIYATLALKLSQKFDQKFTR